MKTTGVQLLMDETPGSRSVFRRGSCLYCQCRKTLVLDNARHEADAALK